MKISVVISSYWVDDEKPSLLKRCVDSLVDADEILTLVTFPKASLSFAEAHNRIATLATGDYIIVVGDNAVLAEGSLKDMCIPNTVTSPLINSAPFGASGIVIYCMPRNIYEKVGIYDPIFYNGSHWEDTDLLRNLYENNIEVKQLETVNFSKSQNGRTIESFSNFEEKRQHNQDVYFKKWKDIDSSTAKMRLEAQREFDNKFITSGIIQNVNLLNLDGVSQEEKDKRKQDLIDEANKAIRKWSKGELKGSTEQ